ncbi:hypothetical protein MiAbW_02277 [Microcystis aeruginosa NIES-4325]|uniref:Uncharacterized protein n=1 Tax=Microcystis aeruginosa NIES-4325 TaxID=2569534 RepID=A0A5J4FCL7_MICAE|nr:hypothetical protein MiAbW_02277 [Microcystis aeruginosa NIES-4325]
MRSEYDFSSGIRGKYYEAYFQDSASVNEALRLLAKIAKSGEI